MVGLLCYVYIAKITMLKNLQKPLDFP